MQFELTKEYIEEVQDALEEGRADFLIKINELHPADIAEIFNEISEEEALLLYPYLEGEIAADVLIELQEDVREKFLGNIGPKEIAEKFINHMDSDDAADVMAELSDKKKDDVISMIKDSEQASDIVDLLNYPEDSAGV